MASSKRGFLEPKVKDPDMLRKHKNGQAINPPTYMQLGGFTSAAGLKRGDDVMQLQKGPQAQAGKPI